MDILTSHCVSGKSANSLITDALEALHRKTEIRGEFAKLDHFMPGAYRADAIIDLVYEDEAHRYSVECKSSVDRKAQIDHLSRQLGSNGVRGLLIAPYLSKELADHCRLVGLQFVDTCGNAYLRARGLYVLVTGEKNERGQRAFRPPKGLTNAAGLRVVFALLSKPELLNSTFKEIATNAGVSLGTTYNVFEDLERRGYLIDRGDAAQRKLLERRRLMDEWTINYPTTLRTKLNGRRFSASDPQWWQHIDLNEVEFAWGSEVAARKMTRHLKPFTQTLYVHPNDMESVIKALAKQHRIRPDPEGEIEIFEKFWHWHPEAMPDIAPPLLVYAELLAILDPRTQETANTIKEQFIDPAFGQG